MLWGAICQESCYRIGFTPWGHSTCQEAAPVWAFWDCSFLQGTSTCCAVGFTPGCSLEICINTTLYGQKRDKPLHHVSLHRLQGNPYSGSWDISFLLPWPRCLSHYFLTFLSYSFCTAYLNHFLNTFSQRHYQLGCQAQLCPEVQPSAPSVATWNQLEWGRPTLSSQSSPAVPTTKTLPGNSNTVTYKKTISMRVF